MMVGVMVMVMMVVMVMAAEREETPVLYKCQHFLLKTKRCQITFGSPGDDDGNGDVHHFFGRTESEFRAPPGCLIQFKIHHFIIHGSFLRLPPSFSFEEFMTSYGS